MRQPLVFRLGNLIPPLNPVAAVLARRFLRGAAGKHIRSRGAQRRADTVALKAIRIPQPNNPTPCTP